MINLNALVIRVNTYETKLFHSLTACAPWKNAGQFSHSGNAAIQ